MPAAAAAQSLEDQLKHLAERLTTEFAAVADAQSVSSTVEQAVIDLGETKVDTFVPVLVERAARQRLRALTAV